MLRNTCTLSPRAAPTVGLGIQVGLPRHRVPGHLLGVGSHGTLGIWAPWALSLRTPGTGHPGPLTSDAGHWAPRGPSLRMLGNGHSGFPHFGCWAFGHPGPSHFGRWALGIPGPLTSDAGYWTPRAPSLNHLSLLDSAGPPPSARASSPAPPAAASRCSAGRGQGWLGRAGGGGTWRGRGRKP